MTHLFDPDAPSPYTVCGKGKVGHHTPELGEVDCPSCRVRYFAAERSNAQLLEWNEVVARWVPPIPPAPSDPAGLVEYFRRLNAKWFGTSDNGFTDEEAGK